MKNHTRRIHWWLSAIVVMLVVTGCGRNESTPSARNGQNTITTPTLDIAATHDHQTMVVEGATANALDLVYNQRIADQTATAFTDPRPTADENNPPTSEPYIPQPTREFRLFTNEECNPNKTTEWTGPDYITNCWHGIVNGHDLFVSAGGVQGQPIQEVPGFLTIKEEVDSVDYQYPIRQGEITIIAAQLPNLLVSVGGSFNVLFNLETRQWVNANGTSIATTTPPSPTATSISEK